MHFGRKFCTETVLHLMESMDSILNEFLVLYGKPFLATTHEDMHGLLGHHARTSLI